MTTERGRSSETVTGTAGVGAEGVGTGTAVVGTQETQDPVQIPQGLSRETTIRRDANGVWFQDEVELSHPHLVDAFNRWIELADDGRYCLKNDINWAYVSIEGAPMFVTNVHLANGSVELSLSDGRTEVLDATGLRLDPAGVAFCDVRDGTMPAKFTRHAWNRLSELSVVEVNTQTGLWLNDRLVIPPVVADPLSRPRRTTPESPPEAPSIERTRGK